MSASTERKNRLAAKEAGTDKKLLAQQEAARKAAVSKRRWILGTIAVILCIALIVFLQSPVMYRITTAETIGSKDYSPAEVKFAKANANYNAYLSYFGEETADMMLDNGMIQSAALLQAAQDEGVTLTDVEKAAVTESLSRLPEVAKESHVSVNRYISGVYGKGMNKTLLRRCMEESVLATKVSLVHFCGLEISDEAIQSYLDEQGSDIELFDYASFFIETNDNRTDAEAQAEAEAIIASFQDGEGEDYVARLNDILSEEYAEAAAEEHSAEAGSSLNESYRAWLEGDNRSAGDIFAAKSTANDGYYVVLFLGRAEDDEPTVAVRHILIQAEAEEDGSYTEEAKAAAKARAEELLAAWEAGDKTETAFATLAYLYSDDTGSTSGGGLYPNVRQGEMVEEFDRFCFEDHNYGDTAIVYGESASYAGYHIIFYVRSEAAKLATARDALANEAMNTWYGELTEGLEPVRHWAYKLA